MTTLVCIGGGLAAVKEGVPCTSAELGAALVAGEVNRGGPCIGSDAGTALAVKAEPCAKLEAALARVEPWGEVKLKLRCPCTSAELGAALAAGEVNTGGPCIIGAGMELAGVILAGVLLQVALVQSTLKWPLLCPW